jgi:putative ubiquitin-RnfH superfamily antitoxin RatB of RatAB toxin-antitoxin module
MQSVPPGENSVTIVKADTILKQSARSLETSYKQQHYYNREAKTVEQLYEGDRVEVQQFGLGKKK